MSLSYFTVRRRSLNVKGTQNNVLFGNFRPISDPTVVYPLIVWTGKQLKNNVKRSHVLKEYV